jgi:hypothetical protein
MPVVVFPAHDARVREVAARRLELGNQLTVER